MRKNGLLQLGCCLLLLTSVAILRAQDGMAEYRALAERTSMTREGIRPWHIHANVQLYDLSGNKTATATFEEWYASQKMYEVVITSPKYSATTYSTMFIPVGTLNRESFLLRQLAREITKPVIPINEASGTKVISESRKIHGETLTCLRSEKPRPDAKSKEVYHLDDYCFEPQSGSLRIHSGTASEVVRNSIGHFLDTSFALDHSIVYDGKTAITAHVDKLEIWDTAKNPIMMPSESTQGTDNVVLMSPMIQAGKLIESYPPQYPVIAREHHEQGTVVLCARVSKAGKVIATDVVASPSINLTGAAINAVQSWKYSPFSLKGEPVDVDMTILLNFNLGRPIDQ